MAGHLFVCRLTSRELLWPAYSRLLLPKDTGGTQELEKQDSLCFIGLFIQSVDRRQTDTPVVCSVALRATQTNSARHKHSYSSVRPVGLLDRVYVRVCEGSVCARACVSGVIQWVLRCNPTAVFRFVSFHQGPFPAWPPDL